MSYKGKKMHSHVIPEVKITRPHVVAKKKKVSLKTLIITLAVLFMVFISYHIGQFVGIVTVKDPRENLIVYTWGDGKYGKATYAVEVYLVPNGKTYFVKAKINIGSPSYYHPCGIIGTVKDRKEAVERFGEVYWSETGISIGGTKAEYFIAKKKYESHR